MPLLPWPLLLLPLFPLEPPWLLLLLPLPLLPPVERAVDYVLREVLGLGDDEILGYAMSGALS